VRDNERQSWQDWAENAVGGPAGSTSLGLNVVPLLPDHGVHLFCLDGDGQRFARLFREVWGELPLSIRLRLLNRWSGPRRALAGVLDGIAQAKYGFTVCLAGMDSVPDHTVECLIARQLAQAVFEMERANRLRGGAESSSGRSGEADPKALAESWGFEMDVADNVCCDQKVDANEEVMQ